MKPKTERKGIAHGQKEAVGRMGKLSICLTCSLLLLLVQIRADSEESENGTLAVKRAALRPLRRIDGRLVDLTPLLEWGQKYPEWLWRPVVGNRPLNEWRFVGGQVAQLLDDGVLVRPAPGLYAPVSDQPILIRHVPNEKTLIDGNFVADAAVHVGRFQYVNTAGAKMTVAAFDCGSDATEQERVAWEKEEAKRQARLAQEAARQSALEARVRAQEEARRANELAITEFYRKSNEQAQAELLLRGQLRGYEFDKHKEIEIEFQQASNGVREVQYKVGLRYLRGEGIKADWSQARRWFKAAAVQGYPAANGKLALLDALEKKP